MGWESINKLGEACKTLNVTCSINKGLSKRHLADKALENKACERVRLQHAGVGVYYYNLKLEVAAAAKAASYHVDSNLLI